MDKKYNIIMLTGIITIVLLIATQTSADDITLSTLIPGGQWQTSSTEPNDIYYDTGNVGIGTDNPVSKLSVSGTGGDFPIQNDAFAQDITILSAGVIAVDSDGRQSREGALRILGTAVPSYDSIALVTHGDPGAGFAFVTRDTTTPTNIYKTRMVIKGDDGNVGIGTTGPTRSLSINHATDAYNSWNVAGVEQWVAGYETVKNAFILYDSTPGNYRMVIDNNGNVGIGTTNPATALDMGTGTLTIGTTTSLIPNTNTGSSARTLRFNNSTSDDYEGFQFYNSASSTTLMMIRQGGNVGIGTTAPGGKLDVNGTIYQRGTQLHADYVFEPSYNLESIEEHSAYMWQNKHLKAVPNAQKDETGQDMVEYGARNRGILEELEKAHVYIQQLNERIVLLETEIKELKKQETD